MLHKRGQMGKTSKIETLWLWRSIWLLTQHKPPIHPLTHTLTHHYSLKFRIFTWCSRDASWGAAVGGKFMTRASWRSCLNAGTYLIIFKKNAYCTDKDNLQWCIINQYTQNKYYKFIFLLTSQSQWHIQMVKANVESHGKIIISLITVTYKSLQIQIIGRRSSPPFFFFFLDVAAASGPLTMDSNMLIAGWEMKTLISLVLMICFGTEGKMCTRRCWIYS